MLKIFQRPEKRSNDNLLLTLDIGSDMVKALIVEPTNKKAIVRGYGAVRQNQGEMHNGAVTDIAGVIENCQQAIAYAEKQAGAITTQMIIGIAGELVKGETITTTYRRKDPHNKINMAELKEIVHKQQSQCFNDIRKQFATESGYQEIEIKHVNAAIVGMEIDGQKVTNPIGFQGKHVTLSIFNAFAPLVHYGALQTIAQELDLDLLAIASEPYAIARSFGFAGGHNESGIFIDIGGGTTDIAIVRNGIVEATKMFMLGGRTFTKRLSHSLNLSFLDAEAVKIAYSNEQLEKHSYKLVREAMKADAEVWLAGVELCISDCKRLDQLPSRIYLCGGSCQLPELKESLDSSEWRANLKFAKQPRVQILDPTQITSISDPLNILNNVSQITPLALANIGLELAGGQYLLGKLLNKVVRLLQAD